jgi:glutamine synthetase
MTAAAEVVDAIVAALDAQHIALAQYYPELGHGQHELSVLPRPALAAADTQVFVRETIRAVAGSCGVIASLAPKPWPDQAGNGAHIHLSGWDLDGERNLFHDAAGRFGLSSLAEQFVAGILDHAAGLLALTAPSFNSFARLQPQFWSSAFTCWGPDNREATVRVPSPFWGDEAASTNIEFKPADASANPYIAFGGLIAAGLDGIERELAPPPPIAIDPAALADADREAAGIARYPTTLGSALDALEGDDVLLAALGETLARAYLTVRRSEWETYSAAGDEFAFASHFFKY